MKKDKNNNWTVGSNLWNSGTERKVETLVYIVLWIYHYGEQMTRKQYRS